MVFESLVTELLNKYLKPYVKRLDTSQLKLGVWKGEDDLQQHDHHGLCTIDAENYMYVTAFRANSSHLICHRRRTRNTTIS